MRSSPRARARRVEHALAMSTLYEEVLRRDGWACRAAAVAPGRCDGPVRLHHRQPRGRGGPDTAANLVTVCGGATGSEGHHGWIHRDRDGIPTRLGLLVSQHEPAPTVAWRVDESVILPPFGFDD